MGVWVSTLEDRFVNSNFIQKIEKIRSILDNWSARRLTLLGKITIIKTLAVSQIVYILSSLPTPPDILKTINSILYDFLWDGKCDKIKRTNLHALFHLLKKKTIILLITVTGTVHAEHAANDLVERNSTAVLVRVVSERS